MEQIVITLRAIEKMQQISEMLTGYVDLLIHQSLVQLSLKKVFSNSTVRY